MALLTTYKQVGAFILILGLLFQSLQRVLIIGDYYVNTDSYAANCENKANIQLHCNGKCQMMKKLEKEEEKDKQNPQRKVENNKETFFYAEKLLALIPVLPAGEKKRYSPHLVPETVDRPRAIFHPPAA